MRILLVHNRYRSSVPSGENRVVDQEGEALAALGHEVARFGRSSDEIAQWPMVKKAALPARTIWSQETYRDLAATLRRDRPDVVHVHNTFPLLSPAVLYACRDASVPVVATMHNYRLACAGGTFFRNGEVCHDCVHGVPARAIIHGCYRESRAATIPLVLTTSLHRQAWKSLVSAYIFISASQYGQLRECGLPSDRVFVRYNLIPQRSHQRSQPRTPTVVYAGRLEEAKGARLLMTGWDRYLRMSGGEPGLRLVIAGDGTLGGEVRNWASDRPSVEMNGPVSGERCAELIAQARAVVLPSAWEETFGLVAIEAMAAGVPPVAADHGSFAELITPGVDGLLFTRGDPDALARAITDAERNPELYEAYGRQARKTYEKRFDPRRSVEELLKIYRFAIRNPAR